MKRLQLMTFWALQILCAKAQVTDPMITKWWFNTTNQTYTGTNGTFVVNVEAVYYTTSLVYVKSSGVPSYYTDGVTVNGNKKPKFDAKDQTNVFKLPRTQTVGTSATRTYLRDEGAVCVFIDGSVGLSPCDGKSYNSADVWHQLAYKFEGNDFDSYNGHSTPGGQYHHHVDPSPLHTISASSSHSPLIGYAFDGYPVYGPYGYTNTNGTGAIKRMTTSWQLRNITTRTTLPDGSTASSSGPTLASQALGKYFEDYEYVSGSGDLDQYNGRFCVTPDYPSGTYCYFVTVDASLNPEFPYYIGDYMYGVVQSGNMGPTGGNNTVPANATLYNSVAPVELSYFKANAHECSVEISWKSLTESRFKEYQLEVSADGKKYTLLSTKSPFHRNSLGLDSTQATQGGNSTYTYRHEATEGIHYYRLKMIDLDGTFEYSPTVSAKVSCVFSQIPIKIFPNPTTDVVTIDCGGDKIFSVRLYNGTGQIIQAIQTAIGSSQLDLRSLSAGTYVLEVLESGTGNGYMRRIVKQ
jgi:hypothetical protein